MTKLSKEVLPENVKQIERDIAKGFRDLVKGAPKGFRSLSCVLGDMAIDKLKNSKLSPTEKLGDKWLAGDEICTIALSPTALSKLDAFVKEGTTYNDAIIYLLDANKGNS